MERAKGFLHAQMDRDIGLDELASYSGMDRFRLTRQFQRTYGLSPHAYLVRLRLRTARALLANGQGPAQVATKVGFADQSHLGRWFQRAYRLTPAAYQRQCTNVLD
jgi:AraC-like DNA-binding protein